MAKITKNNDVPVMVRLYPQELELLDQLVQNRLQAIGLPPRRASRSAILRDGIALVAGRELPDALAQFKESANIVN